jgi:hypothetical protein
MKSRKFIDHDTYISDLDKRFIDKEELKEKINNIIDKYKQEIFNNCKYKSHRILKISELEKILELIDKC